MIGHSHQRSASVGRSRRGVEFAVGCLSTAVALGATATFTPVGPTAIAPGTPVTFSVSVSAQTLAGFNSADIVIGSNDASDVTFTYAPAWQAAFANVTPPTPDLGLYAQDVFVGGNNPTSVGRTLALGDVIVHTEGLVEGTYRVSIDSNAGPEISSLILAGVHEGLSGEGTFTIVCPPADPQCDADVDLADFRLMLPCVTGPDQTPSGACSRYDANADGIVDLWDVGEFLQQFTGAR